MADLPKAGVSLVAENASAFNSALAAGAAAVDKFGVSLDKAGQSGTKSGEVMTGALRRVGEVAVNALASAASAVGSFIATSVKGAGDYEQAMNVLQSTTGATDDQMQAVKDTAKALGADLTLPATSAASAGDAMLYLAQQGLTVNDAMAAAKGTLQLAAAGMVDEKEAAVTTATALNQFGLAGSEATRVADLLAASVSASGSGVAQTGQAIQQAGTAFASAHVPLEDFITLINEMSKAGIKGSDAGTSLKTMMQRLEAPTKAAAQQMATLGVHVYDAQGAMLPMRTIIGQFSASLSGLTQKQRDQAIVTIFGSDAQRAANIILAGGVDAYDKMRGAVTRNGAAAQLASAQMKGLNGAVAGLGSQLETLALEALEPLLPMMTGLVTEAAKFAGSFIGQVGPAVRDAISIFTTIATTIQTLAIPAIGGLAAVTAAYALTNLPALIASLSGATAALGANALAAGLAALPYIAVGAAIGVVILKYQELQDKITSATDQVLAQKQFWTDSAAAIERYGMASGAVAEQLRPLADNITVMRDLIHGETEQLGLLMVQQASAGARAGLYTAQITALREQINQHAQGLAVATSAYNDQEQALLRATAGTMTATAQTEQQTSALAENVDQIQLTEKELDQLAKDLEKVFKEGAQAVDDYVNQASSLMEQLTDTNKATGDRITADQAEAYAKQAAAQRAHLGEMLSEYTLAQQKLGNITTEQADKILGAIEQQFGTADDTSARTFLHMEQAIDQFASNGGASAAELSGKLGLLTDDAIKTKEHMDALAKQYTAELVQNFKDGKIDAEELRKALEEIPEKVYSEVTITERRIFEEEHRTSEHAGKAAGGPVMAGQTYTVGERGMELFTPQQNGYITPNNRINQIASPQQIINLPPPQVVIVQTANTTNITNNAAQARRERAVPSFRAMQTIYGSRG